MIKRNNPLFLHKKINNVNTTNGDKMNENNELLMYIYKNADMGVKSTTKLITKCKW